jgi:dipeptidyl aminopeptidase/acylaminoacyl peptidase
MNGVENTFRPELHIFGDLSYTVLGPNYHGSSGYGNKIFWELIGKVGDGEEWQSGKRK